MFELLHCSLYKQLVEYPAELSVTQIEFILTEVAKGLKFLHDRNMIHRDLKGANILVSIYIDSVCFNIMKDKFGFDSYKDL